MTTMGTTEEGSLPTEQGPVSSEKTIYSLLTKMAEMLFGFTGLYERWRDEYETRRYRDPRERDPDYNHDLRELEGDIEESESRLRIGHYNEGGESKDASWQKWILGIVSVSLVGMLSWALGKLDTLNQEVATLQATQTMGFAAIAQRQTADEQRVDRLESRVFRGNP